MGRRKNDADDIIQFERYSATIRARLEFATRKYLHLLLEEKIRWLRGEDRWLTESQEQE